MGRGRPKGSKNRKTLERERIAHLAEAQEQPEKPMIFEDATKDTKPTNIIIPEREICINNTCVFIALKNKETDMATAKKLPSGNWRVRVCIGKDENGKYKYKSFTDKDKSFQVYNLYAK
jgi:hypothetical protein